MKIMQGKLISFNEIKGYKISDIRKVLTKKQWSKFSQWSVGQTVGKYEKEIFIYKVDFERFLNNLPPSD